MRLFVVRASRDTHAANQRSWGGRKTRLTYLDSRGRKAPFTMPCRCRGNRVAGRRKTNMTKMNDVPTLGFPGVYLSDCLQSTLILPGISQVCMDEKADFLFKVRDSVE